jgi:hypothetical protein
LVSGANCKGEPNEAETSSGAGVRSALLSVTASRIAAALGKRFSMSRSSARTMADSTAGGISGRKPLGKKYLPSRMWAKTCALLSSSKGVRPHNISYRTTPVE